jgi:hypothetical protein
MLIGTQQRCSSSILFESDYAMVAVLMARTHVVALASCYAVILI